MCVYGSCKPHLKLVKNSVTYLGNLEVLWVPVAPGDLQDQEVRQQSYKVLRLC